MSPLPLGIVASAHHTAAPADDFPFLAGRSSVISDIRAYDQSGTTLTALTDRAGTDWAARAGNCALTAAATPTGKPALTFSGSGAFGRNVANLMKGVIELEAVDAFSTFQNSPSYAPSNIMGKQGDYASSGNSMPQWVRMKLTTPKVVTQYQVASAQGGRAPRDWQFQGSHDGVNWDTLDTRTAQPSQGLATFDFANSTPYRWYRYNVTAINGGDLLYLTGLYLTGVDLRGTDRPYAEQWLVVKGTLNGSGHPVWFSSVGDTRYPFSDGHVYTGWGTNTRYTWNTASYPILNLWKVYRLQRDGATAREYMDNTLRLTATGGDTFMPDPQIGRGGSVYFTGQIAHSVVLAEKLSDPDATQFDAELRAFYI